MEKIYYMDIMKWTNIPQQRVFFLTSNEINIKCLMWGMNNTLFFLNHKHHVKFSMFICNSGFDKGKRQNIKLQF